MRGEGNSKGRAFMVGGVSGWGVVRAVSGRSFGRGRSVGVSEGLVRGVRERIGEGCRKVVRVWGRGKRLCEG